MKEDRRRVVAQSQRYFLDGFCAFFCWLVVDFGWVGGWGVVFCVGVFCWLFVGGGVCSLLVFGCWLWLVVVLGWVG
ncbi:hypothetical protein, partial [Escherichia coli]|uniref:hypothetical protein n=1 Tax=Escherichia coli TaxID=562 RepID=UPI003F9F4ECC